MTLISRVLLCRPSVFWAGQLNCCHAEYLEVAWKTFCRRSDGSCCGWRSSPNCSSSLPRALGSSFSLRLLFCVVLKVGFATRPKSTQAPPLTSRPLISSVIGLEAKPPTRTTICLPFPELRSTIYNHGAKEGPRWVVLGDDRCGILIFVF